MGSEQDNEDLKTLGSGLKTARESKGLSLKDVNEKTRISVSILDAIENDRFHLLPPGVYTRNFIRTYADFLGVDSQELLDHFTKEREQTAPPVLQKTIDISAVNHRRYGKSLPRCRPSDCDRGSGLVFECLLVRRQFRNQFIHRGKK